jgi:hypothetical protein
MTDDFYHLMGVPEDASRTEIRAAFRHKVQEYHPDHNDDPRATAQFTALKMAYDTLNDEDERQAYDRLGHEEYVSERLDGLPAPEQWPSTGTSGGTDETTHDRADRSATSQSTTATDRSAGAGGQSTTATGSSRASNSRSNSGTRTTTDGGGATPTKTSSHAAAGHGNGDSGLYDVAIEWLLRNDVVQWLVGWRLLYLSVVLYLSGVSAYVIEQRTAIGTALDGLVTNGELLASRGDLVSMSQFLLDGLSTTSPAAVLFAVGIVCYPAVVFVLVSITRKTPGWRPTLLYVAAALAPALGVLAAMLTGPDSATFPLAVDVVVFLLAPVGAFVTMLFSANVRPVLLQRLERDG